MLRRDAAVVVGVSGGPDSVCLLHLLVRLAASPALSGLRLHVAHLNHGLRGAEADADAAFVAGLAARWGLPCTVGRADVPALAARPGLSVEEAARQARYRFLADVARSVAADTIAVGHNADDQAETVLMHFLRGSGIAGLRGMLPVTALADYRLEATEQPEPPVGPDSAILSGSAAQPGGRTASREGSLRGAGDALLEPDRDAAGLVDPLSMTPSSLRLVRPLLAVPRADILACCAAGGLPYRFDRSNEDTTFYRNRLRHELLPLLETYNPAIRAVLAHTAEVMAGDYEVLSAEAARAWQQVVVPPAAAAASSGEIQFDLAGWRGLPVGLQRGLVRAAVQRLRRSLRNINWEHVERAVRLGRAGQPGQAATLAAGLELQVGADRLRIAAEGTLWPAGVDVPQLAAPCILAAPGVTALPGGWQVIVSRLPAASLPPAFAANPDPWTAWLDAGAVGPVLTLRPRVPGDRLQPRGMGGHAVRLNELMINLKIPRAVREGWPLLVGQAGIAWACGLRIDERAAIGATTVAIWHVEFRRAHE